MREKEVNKVKGQGVWTEKTIIMGMEEEGRNKKCRYTC